MIRLFDTESEEDIFTYGRDIDNFQIEEISLEIIDENIIYTNYQIANQTIIFPKIPENFDYHLEIKLKGYQKAEWNGYLQYGNAYDNIWNIAMYFIPEDEEVRLYSEPFRLIDQNNNPLQGIEFGFSMKPNEILGKTLVLSYVC